MVVFLNRSCNPAMSTTSFLLPLLPPAPFSPGQAELIASEMLFAGTLSELTPAEAVALVSSLVFQVRCM